MLTGSREIYAAMLERVDDGVGMIYAELEAACEAQRGRDGRHRAA